MYCSSYDAPKNTHYVYSSMQLNYLIHGSVETWNIRSCMIKSRLDDFVSFSFSMNWTKVFLLQRTYVRKKEYRNRTLLFFSGQWWESNSQQKIEKVVNQPLDWNRTYDGGFLHDHYHRELLHDHYDGELLHDGELVDRFSLLGPATSADLVMYSVQQTYSKKLLILIEFLGNWVCSAVY